jgi:hypothetical protein
LSYQQNKHQKRCLHDNQSTYYLFLPNLKSVHPSLGEGTADKWCIHNEFEDGHFGFAVSGGWCYRHFLTFKTKEDASVHLFLQI